MITTKKCITSEPLAPDDTTLLKGTASLKSHDKNEIM